MIEIATPKFRLGKLVATALLTILAACTFGNAADSQPERGFFAVLKPDQQITSQCLKVVDTFRRSSRTAARCTFSRSSTTTSGRRNWRCRSAHRSAKSDHAADDKSSATVGSLDHVGTKSLRPAVVTGRMNDT